MSKHNRYLIYKLLGRHVDVRLPIVKGGKRIVGTVERVLRDIFDNMIEMTINGNRHLFCEPQAIVSDGDNIIFLYGDIETLPDDDRNLFDSDFNGYGESINEHLRRTSNSPITKTVFRLGQLKKTPVRRWRSGVAVP